MSLLTPRLAAPTDIRLGYAKRLLEALEVSDKPRIDFTICEA